MLISITDFTSGQDTLDFQGGWGDDDYQFATQGGANGVLATVRDAENLAEAITAIRANESLNGIVQFVLDDNLYIYASDVYSVEGESLIELAGVSTLLTSSDFTDVGGFLV